MFHSRKYANLLLPLPLPGYFTYSVPDELADSLQVGVRVVVQFGKKKLYTALVREIHEKNPGIQLKPVISQIDINPVVNVFQFEFWEWLAKYYMCTMGEVMNAALPPALKLSSESRIALHPEFNGDYNGLNEKEYRIVTVLEQRAEISIGEAAAIAGQLRVIPLINALIEKNMVQAYEEVIQRYTPKTAKYYKLSETYRNDDKALTAMLDYLEKRAPRQLEVMQAILHHCEAEDYALSGVPKAIIMSELHNPDAALRTLVEKGLIEETERKISRLNEHVAVQNPEDVELTQHQQEAFDAIKTHFTSLRPVLLHGITSSGKTEIYIKLIDEALKKGKQVLYLLPEIALTAHIISRLRKYFGDVVGVYHSRFGDAERAEVWGRVAAWQDLESPSSHQVILGARSALFLPFSNLGLIIIDEEHDHSYKQGDPNPRYHARDAAIYLAMKHHANVLLGSATPALESYFNAKHGKYGLVSLTRRYGDMLLPLVQVADIKEATRLKQMKSHFSPVLLQAMENAIAKKEQVILFQNRRGFSLRIECSACNFIPACQHCDVTLIYHKRENQLRCHYCGYNEPVPPQCPRCQHPEMKLIGFGTEKVEEELALLYPGLRIARMDLDTTRSKYSHHRIISDFEERRIDVLTGTQMVTKGLDFDNVSLVGILNADNMVSFPDFRSFERSYQLMAQVSGRAGRKNRQGKVIIQTRNPQHPVIKFVIENDYDGMYELQIAERRQFNYPPYSRLVKITLKHRDAEPLNKAAAELTRMLRKEFPKQILGPEFPVIPRIRNYYMKDILIKLRRDATLFKSKENIASIIAQFMKATNHKQIKVVIDVDPV